MQATTTLLLLGAAALAHAGDFDWAPNAPAKPKVGGNAISNGSIALTPTQITNLWTREALNLAKSNFTIVFRDGKSVDGKLSGETRPSSFTISGSRSRSGLGWQQTFKYPHLSVRYRLAVIDNENYARAELQLTATDADADVSQIDLLHLAGKGLHVEGKTPGSPVISNSLFAGLEHPMSESAAKAGIASCSIKRLLPIRKGSTVTYTAVIGVAAQAQMRRAFLNYVESERPRPYQPFLHYNSWYDIGYFTPYDQKDCIDRIDKFGKALVQDRKVKVASYLFDDGWDNYQSAWEFHKGFPNGFLPVRDEAAKYGGGPGVWLSPWGGYGGPRKQRLEWGKAHGYEVDSQGYALSGPKYYKRFHDVTLDFVTRQGINQFKFDGTGSPDKHYPGSQFDSDFDAAISLIKDLRKAKQGLFINLTTGTWPSPFWLQYADSIWRGGSDHSFAGVGSYRQQWITYRDSDTYHGIVQRGPLFPINSLMLHGLIFAQHAQHLSDDPKNDFRDEIRDYFGCGTQLQEMYITPDLMTKDNWDDLAESAKWSQANADVMKDVHWIGGDPNLLEVYGWAAWSKDKSIITLRNPSDQQQAFSVDIASVLELPPGSPIRYQASSPYSDEKQTFQFTVGQSQVIDLQPFQVLTLELKELK